MWWANDTSNSANSSTQYFNVTDNIAPEITITTPINGTNYSSNSIIFNFTVTDNYYSSVNCSVIMNSSINTTNTTTLNNTATEINISDFVDGEHVFNISCNDESGSQNETQLRTMFIDTQNPTFNSFSTSPSTEAELDPEINFTVQVNITDNITTVDSVKLQYKLTNDTYFVNTSMAYSSVELLYNGSFNASLNGTYTIRFWANDSAGNEDFSTGTNYSIEYDNNWTRSPSSFTTVNANISQNVTIGNLTINNTGDFDLHFNVTSNSETTFYNESSNFTVAAGSIKSIEVNDSTDSEGVKSIILTTTVNDSSVTPNSLTTTGSIVAAGGQPTLIATFTTPLAETLDVTQGDTAVPFVAQLENTGDGNATNVTFNITLPDGWNITFGQSGVEIDDGDMEIDSDPTELSIEITVPSNETPGEYTILANATGYNLSGSDLNDLGFIFTDIVTVTVASSTTTTVIESITGGSGASPSVSASAASSSTAGGGGGGGSATTQSVTATEKIVNVKRGEPTQTSLVIDVSDSNVWLKNLTLEISGELAEYVTSSPEMITEVSSTVPGEFILDIDVPSYFSASEYNLTATVSGIQQTFYPAAGTSAFTDYSEEYTIVIRIEEVAEGSITESFDLTSEMIDSMISFGFNTEEVEELLTKAGAFMDEEDFTSAQEVLDEIELIYEQAFEAFDKIEEVKALIEDAESKRLTTTQTTEALALSELAFERGEYELALERAKAAELTYVLETRGQFDLVYIVITYWWAIILLGMFGLTLFYFSYRTLQVWSLKQKIKQLNKEEKAIHKLLHTAQIEYLKKGTISVSEHKETVEQYKKRLIEIKKQRANARNHQTVILQASAALQNVNNEKSEVINHIKSLQTAYLVQGKISREEFQIQTNQFNERIAEIDSEESIIKEKLTKQRAIPLIGLLNKYKQRINANRPDAYYSSLALVKVLLILIVTIICGTIITLTVYPLVKSLITSGTINFTESIGISFELMKQFVIAIKESVQYYWKKVLITIIVVVAIITVLSKKFPKTFNEMHLMNKADKLFNNAKRSLKEQKLGNKGKRVMSTIKNVEFNLTVKKVIMSAEEHILIAADKVVNAGKTAGRYLHKQIRRTRRVGRIRKK